MVHTLLGTIEGCIDHMRDGTIPNIATMADEPLAVEPKSSSSQNKLEPEPADAMAPEAVVPNIDDEPAHSETAETPPSMPEEAAAQQSDGTEHSLREFLSPGIRSLISRLQDTFPAGENPAPVDDE